MGTLNAILSTVAEHKDVTAARPVKMGDYLSLSATGGGQTSTAVNVSVIQYYGTAPGELAGLLQINILIPPAVRPGGYVPVILQVGTVVSQPGVSVAVAAN